MKKRILTLLLTGMLGAGTSLIAQDVVFPKPSPNAIVKQGFATSFVELNYSRPSAKGRVVFGELVPYGEVWRTGANAATTIEFGQNVKINGKEIMKGKYGLLSIPNKESWTIIITKDLNVTSANAYKKENDIVRIESKTNLLNQNVETFTIEVSNISENKSSVEIKWEKVSVSFDVTAEFESELIAQIEKTMSTDNRPYYASAQYYYTNKKDLSKALEWIRMADKQSPGRYWIENLKAKIELENKLYVDAIETATKAKDNATKAGNAAYAKQMEDLIKSIESNPEIKLPKKKK